MAKDLFSRYIWLIDTIKRHGRITREEINECWKKSKFSNGENIPRRTFYNYRLAIEDLFDINIECDPSTFEYFIAEEDKQKESVTNWLLNTTATNGLLTSARDIADRVFIEEVPSAREHLSILIEALRVSAPVKFDYHPYTRSLPTKDVVIEPYFTKIFKQRWYVVGRNVKENKIKTYALDRMNNVTQQSGNFKMPDDFVPADYFTDAFGIVVDQSEPKRICIRTDTTQAKYFRALPLHHSQTEMVHDQYSVFEYKMRVTTDLVRELLSYGPKIVVLEPPELRTIMRMEAKRTLENYTNN